jgi:hypothetical protein
MAFGQQKTPSIFHSALVGNPTQVTIKSAPRSVKNGQLIVVDVLHDGVQHGLFCENQAIADGFANLIGETVVLVAEGSRAKATMEFRSVGGGAIKPVAKPIAGQAAQSTHTERDAKIYLCQATNLMRLCCKKAADISVELSLDAAREQSIAASLFINASQGGFIKAMPLDPIPLNTAKHAPEPEPASEEVAGVDIPF